MHTQHLRRRAGGLVAIIAAAALALGGCSTGPVEPGSGDAPFYEGKTIKLLVPFAPGGGTDVTARLFAPLLSKHIPGNPTVIVENQGGGGSITGVNAFELQEPRDGTTILWTSGSTHSTYALGNPAIQWDFDDYHPVIGLPFGGALYVSANTGIVEPEDILDPPGAALVFAGEDASGGDLRRLLALDLLGVDFQAVFGYEGAGDSTLAFERGEATISSSSVLPFLNEIVPQIEAGAIVPIMSTGFVQEGELVRVPSLPDLMTPAELYESATGKTAAGPEWGALMLLTSAGDSLSKAMWLHADAPQEAIDAVEFAIAEMFSDAESAATLEDELAGNEPYFGEALRLALSAFLEPDPAAVAWLQNYLVERWDYPPFD